MLKLTEARKDSFLLESVTGGEVRGRYSIMGMKPDLIWECRGTAARLNRSARFDPDAWADADADPLASLRALIAESRIDLPPELPPMAAGLFGYLGYDMVRLVERLPDVNPDPLGLPDALMIRPSVILVVDGVKGEVTVVSPAWAGSGLSARAAYAQAAERVMDAVRDLDRTPPPPTATPARPRPRSRSRTPAAPRYLAMVERAKDYIRAGDIFQVVPSQRWAMPFDAAAVRALPRAPADQPLALHVLLQLRRLPGDRRQPRDPRARQGRHRDDPPDRRHPAARRHAGRGPRARGRAARRPQGARRAPDAARPRPQRRRPRREDRQRRS